MNMNMNEGAWTLYQPGLATANCQVRLQHSSHEIMNHAVKNEIPRLDNALQLLQLPSTSPASPCASRRVLQ
jgi:hypothetical protein